MSAIILVIITRIISFYVFNDKRLFDSLKHHPAIEYNKGQYYRWLLLGFVHGDYMHLFVNIVVLYQFGGLVESYL
ncbi:MAG: rhomboid family intramembrane serine protease, partial [Saprospiraceae bacterium]|nr:rhomboid family intramembrane serine protease [Saprospiraceae bacterium]